MNPWAIAGVVVGGLILAVLTPYARKGFRWTVTTYHDARSDAVASRLAPYLVSHINGHLGLDNLRDEITDIGEDVEYIKEELTINGGITVKDRILSVERQLEQIITDR